MSVMKACCIHDVKAEAWLPPMFFQSNAQAVRSFGDAVRNENTEFGKHPEDYHLYVIGEFDEQSGELSVMSPVHLIHGANIHTRGE